MTTKQHLTHLESTGLLRVAQTHPEVEYLFRHVLIQDAAYRSLLRENRKKLHLKIGETIERTYSDQVTSSELAPVLADHFDKAGDEPRALKYFTLAGDADAAIYANAEAVEHYTQALEIARRIETSNEKLTHLYTSLGRALELGSQFDRALATYKDMERLAKERNDDPLKLGSLIAQVTLYGTPTPLHDPDRGKALGQQAITLARDLGNQSAEAKLLWILSNTCLWTSNIPQAIDYGERSLTLARQLNLREQMAYTLKDLAFNCYATIGYLDQAQPAVREASNLWRELGNLPMLTDSLAAACYCCLHTGEYDQALAFSEEAFQLSQSIGSLWGQSNSVLGVGRAYWERGQPDQAVAVMEEGLRLSELSGFYVPQILTRADLAMIYGGLGATEPGLEIAHRALALAEAQIPVFRPYALGVLAQLLLLNGDLAEAEAVINQGIKDPNREVWLAYSLSFHLANCELPLKQGNYERAITATNTFLTDFRQFRAHIPKVLYFQGQALLGLGRDNPARDRLRKARTEAEAIDARWMLWQILAALSQIEPDPTIAQQLRQQTGQIIETIAHHTPAELRDSFLNRPEVQTVMA